MKFTEENLKDYATPLSETEDMKCKNAINMVRDALKELGFSDDGRGIQLLFEGTSSYSLNLRSNQGNREVKIFVQGSYANNTNVRQNSDVDVAVILESTFIPKYRPGITGVNYGFGSSSDNIKVFKDDVQSALEKKFGKDKVERKDKSIKVSGNKYRVDADTVPATRYRDYSNDYLINESNYLSAIYIVCDSGKVIINYPEQHIINGKKKNIDTSYYYKKMVRIIKKIRYIMLDYGLASANNVSSFGLESLLWNIPNDIFKKYHIYKYQFDEIVKYLVSNEHNFSNYKEANGIKPLFEDETKIEYYKKFIHDLKKFYQYDI